MRTSLNQLLIEQNKGISKEVKRSLKNYKQKLKQDVYINTIERNESVTKLKSRNTPVPQVSRGGNNKSPKGVLARLFNWDS